MQRPCQNGLFLSKLGLIMAKLVFKMKWQVYNNSVIALVQRFINLHMQARTAAFPTPRFLQDKYLFVHTLNSCCRAITLKEHVLNQINLTTSIQSLFA